MLRNYKKKAFRAPSNTRFSISSRFAYGTHAMHIACRRLSAFSAINREKKILQPIKTSERYRKKKEKQKGVPTSAGIESTGVPYRSSSRTLLCSPPRHSSRLVKSIYAKALPALFPCFCRLLQPNLPPAIGKKFQYLTSRSAVILKPDSD